MSVRCGKEVERWRCVHSTLPSLRAAMARTALLKAGQTIIITIYIYMYMYTQGRFIVQEVCESRGGRPGLSVLTSLLVSVDVKLY